MRYKCDQKYHARERHLYALKFKDGAVYIGQTVDMARRQKEHESVAGGWPSAFDFQHLSTIYGNQLEAEDHERAWRYVAASHGHQIFAKPPGMVVDCRRQQTPSSLKLAKTLRWPDARMLISQRIWKVVHTALLRLGR